MLLFKSTLLDAKFPFDPERALLIYDRRLVKLSREFARWAKSFPYAYGVDSGEELKDLDAFPRHARKLMKIAGPLSPRTMTVVAVGGGSIGDFAGFFASIYKRGVDLVHLPSTWLAAIDSAHGGKTAVNAGGAKNQFGTFYPARVTVLVRSLLAGQPEARVRDALGELGKIALIDGGPWVQRLMRTSKSGEELLWTFLKPAILAKLRVVAKDPREQTGHRQILNLGHTSGHVIEAARGWSHGRAVGAGLFFALEFGRATKRLPERELERAERLLAAIGLAPEPIKPKVPARRFRELLTQDKKREARGEVTFIFLEKIGRTRRVSLPVEKVVAEACRQGWAQP